MSCCRAPGSAGSSASSQDAGLVRRHPDPDDGRATLAAITPRGVTAFRRAAPVYLAGIEEHFGCHLTAADQRAVARALQRVVDAHRSRAELRR